LAEFRWILLGLGLLLMAGIWWWGGRRSAQAPGRAELRETTAKEALRQEAAARDIASPLSIGDPLHGQEWERSPFEPLSIKTSDHEQLQVLHEPMMVTTDEPHIADDADTVPNADTGPLMPPVLTKVVPAAAKLPVQPVAELPPAPAIDTGGRMAAAPGKPNTSEKQKIVTVRVCASDETRWPGSALLSAFESQGLAYGRYQVFHRRHIDGRSLFSVASLVEPGTFDVAQMREQQFKGVTLFAVLPGPVDPLLTVDDMLAAARGLASDLSGSVQDAKGVVLSPQRMAAMRDDIARFQASLAVS
jgi:cell division protein ZipA